MLWFGYAVRFGSVMLWFVSVRLCYGSFRFGYAVRFSYVMVRFGSAMLWFGSVMRFRFGSVMLWFVSVPLCGFASVWFGYA